MLSLCFGSRISSKLCSVVVKRSSAKALRSQKYSSIPSPFSQLLKPNHSQIILAEQNLLSSLLSCLRIIDASKDDIDLIYDTRSRMDDLFLIVVVGEFNSGKSTFINSLIGMNLLKSGVLPTTNKICIVRHESDHGSQGTSWKQADNMLLGDVQEIKIDLHWLKNIAIVDTPGTNAIVSEHEQLTQQIIPRADLILFVTSAERPMSDSESAVLTRIKQWGKKVVMIVNKMDILEHASEKEQVLDFVTQHAAKLLGDTVKLLPIFGVSGRLALNAKLLSPNGNNSSYIGGNSWEDSKFEAFEKYLTSVLGQEQLIQCKLKNPLGVADRIITTSTNEIEKRKNILEGDFRILEMIEENMEAYKNDMKRELDLLRLNIKSLLTQINHRCDKFLDHNITILKPSFLLDSQLFQEEFSKEVLMDINQPVDDIVIAMCDLICKKTKIQARSVVDFVGNRPNKHRDNIIGSVNFVTPDEKQFEASKYELIERVRRNIKNVILNHNQSKNVVKMSTDVRTSALQTAAVQGISVASIGAVTSSNMIGFAAGIVGGPGLLLLGASGSMVLGMFIIPRKKEIIKKEFSERIETLISQIDTVVLNDIEREMQNNENRIKDSIGPYSRFIDSEKKKVYASLATLDVLRKETRDIQNKLR